MKDFHFLMTCKEMLPKIKKYINKRQIVIWGAGNGGKICKYVLEEMGLEISFFVDSKIKREYDEYNLDETKVKVPRKLCADKYYCIISIINPWTDVEQNLRMLGYTEKDYFYVTKNYEKIEHIESKLELQKNYIINSKKEMNVKFSVIVPIYNRESYIEECVNSILNQSYTPYEIILVDDGSNDMSGQICDEYEAAYECVKVLHQQNSGVSVARNNGIKLATGEYLFFLDSDDKMSIDALMSFYEIIQQNPNIDFVHGRMKRFCNGNTIIIDDPTLSSENIKGLNGQEVFILHYLTGRLFGGLHGVYRKKYLLELGDLYIKNLSLGEDLEFNIRIFANTDKLEINENACYEVRVDTVDSLMKQYSSRLFFQNLSFYEYLEKNLYKENYSNDFSCILKRILGERFLNNYFISYIEHVSNEEFEEILNGKNKYIRFFSYYSSSRYQFYLKWISDTDFEKATKRLRKCLLVE